MSIPNSRTFGAFSKFCFNTSKSTNIKLVCRFKGHILPNWRHFKFWSIGAQKLSQRPLVVFWTMENPELHHAFQAKPFTKTYVGLCKCCRGMFHLQLSYQEFLSRSSKIWSYCSRTGANVSRAATSRARRAGHVHACARAATWTPP
jgi:hypothetical protein